MIKEDKINIEISPKIGPDQEIEKGSIVMMIAKIEAKEDNGVKEEIEETEVEIEIKVKEDKEIEITITEEEIIQEIEVMKEEVVTGIVTIDNIGIEIDKEELKKFKKILILSKEDKFKE